MSANFANLPKSVQEEILVYLNSGNFKAAVNCREHHLKKLASSCPTRITHAPFSNKANEQEHR
jgi:hypothetical protein